MGAVPARQLHPGGIDSLESSAADPGSGAFLTPGPGSWISDIF